METNGGTVRDAAAARRRRIAERGAERLALITGRVQSISTTPVPPPANQSDQSSTLTSLPSVSLCSDQLPLYDENTASPLNTNTTNDHVACDIQPPIHKPKTITKTSTQSSPKPNEPNKTQSIPDTLTQQNPPISTTNKPQTFSPSRLRNAIKSSQNTRTICSIITALLVLLSHTNLPIFSNNIIKSIVLTKPLFLLILTNITMVVAPFLLEKVKHGERRGSSRSEVRSTISIGTVLEWGMLVQTGSSGLFMDCSVYSVVLICGMSFLKMFGW